MACAICETRRPRRFCPGVHGDICSLCCGTEREVTVSCPLDCEYLRDARRHDRAAGPRPTEFPNKDIEITDRFLRNHEELLVFTSQSVLRAALATAGANDFDVRDALDALIRTYRTLESGVYYETRPANLLAAEIYAHVQTAVAEFRRQETERLGVTKTRDADVLGVLAFLQRLELDKNNGRRRGRAYLDFLRGFYPQATAAEPEEPSSLIV